MLVAPSLLYPLSVVTTFLGEGWLQCTLSAWYARAGRGVSSPRPSSAYPATM